MNIFQAAAGFSLVLASGSFAASISSDPTGNGCFGNWTVSSYLSPRDLGWAFHPAHRPHMAKLRPSFLQGNHPGLLSVDIPWGPHGAIHHGTQEQLPDLPDTDADPEDEDDGPTAIPAIADQDPEPYTPIPTVPEPGSLAMIGAGALGMFAARAFLRRR